MGEFLAEFAKGGNITAAARHAGIQRGTAYAARESDSAFAAAWDVALHEAADRIRKEVDRRAIEGWEEPVFGSVGNYMDGQIGTIRKFDNGLLARLAVAHCPEFREKNPVAPTVNITIQITPEKMQQLQERKRLQLSRLTAHGAN